MYPRLMDGWMDGWFASICGASYGTRGQQQRQQVCNFDLSRDEQFEMYTAVGISEKCLPAARLFTPHAPRTRKGRADKRTSHVAGATALACPCLPCPARSNANASSEPWPPLCGPKVSRFPWPCRACATGYRLATCVRYQYEDMDVDVGAGWP